jgi:hypothetical protein
MIYFLTASKDASVYLQQPDQNAGLDEVLEVSKVYYGNLKDVSRALLKFETNHLSASISNGSITASFATLILRETESEEIPLEYTIYAHPISGSWEMGNGTRFDEISTTGVTWKHREGDSNLPWLPNNVYAAGSTGSYDGKGGIYYTSDSASQDFDYQSADAHMDITDMVNAWIVGDYPNDGLIIKHSTGYENDTNDYGILRFFSKETNTIYQPKIMIGWDDQVFSTGSLQPLTAEEIKVGLKNYKKEYKVNTTPKIRVFGRELYPLKTFSSTFAYGDVKYLPETTYYQIRDFNSNDIIVPFSEWTKVSCDSDGNYVEINFSNWEVDRVYKIEFKVERNGSIQYFNGDVTFTLVE